MVGSIRSWVDRGPWLAQQLRQLDDVGGDAPGLVAGEQLRRRPASRFVLFQAAAVATPADEQRQVLHFAQAAAEAISLDEAETRALIDQQLKDSGWEADTKETRYASGTRPVKGRNLAIAASPRADRRHSR
jgi:hypothetical protein